MLQVGICVVLERPARAPGVDRRPRPGDRPVGRGPAPGGASARTVTACLSWKALVAVDESRLLGAPPVVGAAPGHEVQLAGLACGPALHEGLQQRRDGLAGQWASEEWL